MNGEIIYLDIHYYICRDSLSLLVIWIVSLRQDSKEQVCMGWCFVTSYMAGSRVLKTNTILGGFLTPEGTIDLLEKSLESLISVSPTSNLPLSFLTCCRLDLVHPGKANPPFKSSVTLGHPEMCLSEILRFLFCHSKIWIRQWIKTIYYFPPFINSSSLLFFWVPLSTQTQQHFCC